MEKNYKKALLLLRDIETLIESRDSLSDEEGRILDEIKTIFTLEQENNYDFDKYLMEKHGEDYQWLDDDMPDKFDEWCSEMDTDERYEYFISFLNI